MTSNGEDLRDVLFSRILSVHEDPLVLTDDFSCWALDTYRETRPDRFLNFGLAEQFLVNFASGAAQRGMPVVIAGLIPFVTSRAFEQIQFSLDQLRSRVTIVGVGPGLSFSFDGPSHHSFADVGLMRNLLNVSIHNPIEICGIENAVDSSSTFEGVTYIRCDKVNMLHLDPSPHPDVRLVAGSIQDASIAVLTTGYLARWIWEQQGVVKKISDLGACVLELSQLYPLPEDLNKVLKNFGAILLLEEMFESSSMIEKVREQVPPHVKLHALRADSLYRFESGDRGYMLSLAGISATSLLRSLGALGQEEL